MFKNLLICILVILLILSWAGPVRARTSDDLISVYTAIAWLDYARDTHYYFLENSPDKPWHRFWVNSYTEIIKLIKHMDAELKRKSDT